MKSLTAVTGASLILSSGAITSTATATPAQVHGSQGISPFTEAIAPMAPELMGLSSVIPAPGSPINLGASTNNARGMDGCIRRYLEVQGYTIVDWGVPFDRALGLAQQAFNGEVPLNSQGVSRSFYHQDGEGMVSRVRSGDISATCNWYMTQNPPRFIGAHRAAVATWATPGGDVYIGQYFTYN